MQYTLMQTSNCVLNLTLWVAHPIAVTRREIGRECLEHCNSHICSHIAMELVGVEIDTKLLLDYGSILEVPLESVLNKLRLYHLRIE